MSSSVRYKFVENQTGVPLTVSNFAINTLTNTDGDDKQEKLIKRVITGADIGTAENQLGDPYGAILDIVPSTSTVLWFQVDVYRPESVVQQGTTFYNNINSDVTPLTIPAVPITLFQTTLGFGLGLDNTLRIADKAHDTASAITVGDIVIAKLITGTKTSTFDVMNP